MFSSLGKLIQTVHFYDRENSLMEFNLIENRLIYISDNQEFFLFHQKFTKNLLVFQLTKALLSGKYKFTFLKDVEVRKKKWESVNVKYFNEITIDDGGCVY